MTFSTRMKAPPGKSDEWTSSKMRRRCSIGVNWSVKTLRMTLAEAFGKPVLRSRSKIWTTPVSSRCLKRLRAPSNMGPDTSTPRYRQSAPKRSISGARASPSEQPRSSTFVLGFTYRMASPVTAWRITSYCGIERLSMSSKTVVTLLSNSHRCPEGVCPRLLLLMEAVQDHGDHDRALHRENPRNYPVP